VRVCGQVADEKLRVLVSHLLDHPALTQLDLSYNVISDRGARALGKLLRQPHCQLTRLALPNNDIQVHFASFTTDSTHSPHCLAILLSISVFTF